MLYATLFQLFLKSLLSIVKKSLGYICFHHMIGAMINTLNKIYIKKILNLLALKFLKIGDAF